MMPHTPLRAAHEAAAFQRRAVREPASLSVAPARQTGWCRLIEGARRLEDSWIGDLIGVICLFLIGYLTMLFFWVLT